MVEMLGAIVFCAYLIELYLCTNLGGHIKLNNLETWSLHIENLFCTVLALKCDSLFLQVFECVINLNILISMS